MTCPVCGFTDKGKGKPRSIDQHRRFYGLVAKAFEQWPHAAEFQPESAEHLRKYLICRAGPQWRNVTEIPVPFAEDQPALTRLAATMMQQAAEAAGGYAFPRVDANGGRVALYTAKSIKFAEMPHLEFCALSEAVDEVIKAELGVEPDDLLKAEAA
jgi:hypothetical protein